MVDDIPRIRPPVGSAEEQDAERRFEDAVEMRLCRQAISGRAQGILDNDAAEAVGYEEDGAALLGWSTPEEFEGG